jgi:DNA polymerase (family 10)
VPRTELSNAAIADALEELGDLYELDGAIVHRVVAYRTAARTVRDAPMSVASLARAGRATELPGIGTTLQEKIVALLETGAIPATQKLRAKFPPGLVAITRLPGLGPKRARLLQSELGVDSPEKLRDAALHQRLRTVRGLGPKFEQSVLQALEDGAAERSPPRVLLPKALEIGEALVARLTELGGKGTRVQLAGSARRQADSVKDLDLIATTSRPATLAKRLGGLDLIETVASAGSAGARARTHSGVGVDLRIAKPAQFGNLLQHFTGSGAHNAALREAAVRRGLHVSEYGVLDDATSKTRTCRSEEELYTLLGLAYIEPELRENRGELDAALADFNAPNGDSGLPRLVELGDIRGDLHSHTVASDGHNTIAEMASAARERGYEYLAITDHSATHGFGNDVPPEQLRRQIELVHEANGRIDGLELLAGSEVNVLPDGSLDYDDELLAELDWVIASVHTAFGISEQAMTERMIAAIEHPLVDAIGHPTGRLIEQRAPYAIDLDAVFAAAAKSGTMLEINANPNRRDLSDVHARAAARAGVRILIDSDAHRTGTLANMRWGVATARRAWLRKQDIVNTRSWGELQPLRKQPR